MPKQKPDNLSERDSHLIDALLKQSLQPNDAASESRVGRLLSEIRTNAADPVAPITPSSDRHGTPRRWLRASLAAVVLVGIMLVMQLGGSQTAAMAAVERSILAEQRPEAREYEVTIVTRNSQGRRRTVTHTLFVRQREFAIRATPRLGTGEIWIGSRGKERWIVPRFGPVQIGNESLLKRTALNQPLISTPFLTVSTILDRIKRSYDLELTAGVSLTEEHAPVVCDHIVGKKSRETQAVIPEHVELWTDTQTGFARRIELRWYDDQARWLEATAQLVDTHDLPAHFFDHTGHHDADRRVNRIGE